MVVVSVVPYIYPKKPSGEVYIEPKTWMWHYIPFLETKQLLYHDS